MKTRFGNILIKSDRALEAEANGRYPAGTVAAKLGVPRGFITAQAPWDGEWHHVSKYANAVRYYDLEQVTDWLGSEDGQEAYREWQERRKEKKTVVYQNAAVSWREWTGSFRHPRAIEKSMTGCEVVDRGGHFVEVRFPSGGTMKKKKAANGFKVVVDGKTVGFDPIYGS